MWGGGGHVGSPGPWAIALWCVCVARLRVSLLGGLLLAVHTPMAALIAGKTVPSKWPLPRH